MRIIAFGGLGVDKKVFEHFDIDVELIVIEWLIPLENEDFQNYLSRLSEVIPTDKPFVLLGVSFGGMVAVELSKSLNPELTILVSSVARRNEVPWLYRCLGKLKLTSWLPTVFLKPPMFLMNYFFGVTKKTEKQLLREIINDTDLTFLRWAIGNILNWENEEIPHNLIRIHGTRDKILPMIKEVDNYAIDGGGHFMIVSHSKRISDLINDKIADKL